MKLNYDISWILIRIPILPWLKITKIEPQVRIIKVPTPTIEPIEEPTPKAIDYPDTVNYPKVRKSPVYYLDKARFRHTGHMVGTEVYQLHDIRKDLIKFFVDNDNKALRLRAIMEHKESPFRHPFVKCNPDCTHRIASEASIRKALNNATYLIEDLEKMFGTATVFVMEELQSGVRSGQWNWEMLGETTSFNGWRLSDEAYFMQLNILTKNNFVTRTLAKEVAVTTETKTPKYGYQREAIDRMT